MKGVIHAPCMTPFMALLAIYNFTNPYNTAPSGNMKARAKKDNSF